MTERFEDYGIYGVNYSGATEQRIVCPKCDIRKGGTNDKDLAVNIEKGTWICFSANCGWTGALRKIKDKGYKPIISKSLVLEDKNYKYFADRGITKEVVERNKITKDKVFMPSLNKTVPVICFNYYVGDTLVNIKYRDLDKNFCQVKDGAKVFYKLNDLVGQTECIITEGEFDALSFEVAGYKNAISVPDGAINPVAKNVTVKLSYLDECAEYFENINRIYLATDNDSAGLRLREELARRLGKYRCWIVNYPDGCKDANEVLVRHGKEKLKELIEKAEPYPIEDVHLAKERLLQLLDIYDNGYPSGAKTGWANLDEYITFYDSCLTVINGIPSHGKSNFTDELMLRLSLKNGWKFGIFSPENAKIEIHLHRLCEILIGKPLIGSNRMDESELIDAVQFVNDNIYFILPKDENYTIDNILDNAKYLVLKHGIKALILDPWNAIIHDYGENNETEYTKKMLNQLLYFERNYGLHLFIVAHPAKMRKVKDSKKYEVPNLYDISGSAHWFNKTELGLTVYREYSEDLSHTLHTTVYIQKVKHIFMGKTGFVKFNFDPSCQRFYEYELSYLERNKGSYLNNE